MVGPVPQEVGEDGGGRGGSPGGTPGGSPGRGTGSPGITNPGRGAPAPPPSAPRSNTLNPYNPYNPYNPLNPYNQSRMLIPKIPESTVSNQQMMFMLAEGTGGFVIHDTNDLLGGLQKIGKEQNEYYLLGYTPPESAEGSCHTLKVKVERGGANVRARSGYCNTKPKDLLAGNPVEAQLETRLASAQAGNMAASMQLPFFYTSDNTARVNLALDIDSSKVKFEKEKGKFHSAVSILGMAYNQDGKLAARFSDTLHFDLSEKKRSGKLLRSSGAL